MGITIQRSIEHGLVSIQGAVILVMIVIAIMEGEELRCVIDGKIRMKIFY